MIMIMKREAKHKFVKDAERVVRVPPKLLLTLRGSALLSSACALLLYPCTSHVDELVCEC